MGGSRAMYSMGESRMLPKIFGELGKKKTPTAAILLVGFCCFIAPFFGKGVLLWLVDAASFGCCFAYLMVSISFLILRLSSLVSLHCFTLCQLALVQL